MNNLLDTRCVRLGTRNAGITGFSPVGLRSNAATRGDVLERRP